MGAGTAGCYLGLVNEPCFSEATGPDPNRYGLWLDQRDPNCPADPFASEAKYPGVKIGARGTTVRVGSYYGEPSGIVGLRLFPNPDFDEKARRNWDPERYYNDARYYESRDLVKPYRVGMSCGFCHVGPNPVKPPADPENPAWENLSSNVGAQYLVGGPHLRLEGREGPGQLLLPAVPQLAPGNTRHLARVHRQHQQPADDERRVLSRPADGRGEEMGPRDDCRRRSRQPAVQRLRARVGSARAVLQEPEHDLDAARPQGRLRLGGRARRAQSRLPEHRPLQRGVAAALPADRRRHARSRRSGSRMRAATPSTGTRPRCRRRPWRGSSWRAPIPIT